MDEAFSALDPLIRAQMQDELLELQAKMHKTIVFITHDLDEALKIGDRIAIMKDGAVVQIGTPEDILTTPADDYVKAFVQNVDKTKVITTESIMRKAPTVTRPKDGPRVAVRAMEKIGSEWIFVVNAERQLQGILTIDDAIELEKEKKHEVEDRMLDEVFVTRPDTPISDLLKTALKAKYPIAVQNDEGRLVGIVDRGTVMAEVLETEETENTPIPLSEATDAGNGTAQPSEEEKSND
jgi:glycine betaine/proline transport system ATP-binding protein